MRRSWPDVEDDYVFRVDGKDAGRCYHPYATASTGWRWRWTVYNSAASGDELTFDDAKAKFKAAYEAITVIKSKA